MRVRRTVIVSAVCAILVAALLERAPIAASAQSTQAAQAPTSAYQPEVGQAGKDVIWVPTPQILVDQMLDMAKATPSDYVIDLGSGDGRTVITAAKRGIRALGIEYNPDMVALAQRNARIEGVSDRTEFVKQDLFESDLSRATVITMFLLPSINLKLMPKLLGLEPGTRIVSNSFKMGDWEPDQTVALTHERGCEGSWCTAHLWIVPARVQGIHHVADGELELKQDYQMLSGVLRTGGRTVPVTGRVVGREVVLSAGARELRGRIVGDRLVMG